MQLHCLLGALLSISIFALKILFFKRDLFSSVTRFLVHKRGLISSKVFF